MLAGILLIGLAAISWGSTGSVTAILVAGSGAQPLLIGAARMALAAALLLPAARLIAGAPSVARADTLRGVAMGACMAVYQAAYFTSVTMTGITVAALIAICSAPLLIAGLAAAFLGERLTGRVMIALVVGIFGTGLLIAGPQAAAPSASRFVAGGLLALLAGLAYALYAVLAKVSLERTAPLPLTALTFSTAALLMVPLLAWTDAPLSQVTRGWPWLVYLGVVATAGAYALYATGLRRVPVSVAGIVTLLEPLTATLLGVLLFGERLGDAGLAGAALLLAAIGIVTTAGSAGTRRS